MRELNDIEIDNVDGAVSSDTSYAASVGVAVGLFAVGAAFALVPGGQAGTIALWSLGGSMLSSGIAISYVIN